jgi:hypothetical protein
VKEEGMADKDKVDLKEAIVQIDTLEDGTESFDNELNEAFLRSLITPEQVEELLRFLKDKIRKGQN